MKKNKLLVFFKQNIFPLSLVFITFLICLLNYQSGTWLSGWDTLHPEFNFPLNFKRLFFGVWREEQGLGAVAGHSHMVDLPRVAVLWILSLVFPTNVLRYLYIFLCLILGPLGVYYFIQYILGYTSDGGRPSLRGHDSSEVKESAFLGGLFYIFNLGTLQHFYVPFEMFCVQFAALGWLFLFATKFFVNGRKKDLFFFALVTFLAAPQAYAATLFYVYFLLLTIYLFIFVVIYKKPFLLKKLFLVLIITFLVNSFWLLPNLYFLRTNAQNVPEAKINLLFSEEAFLKNKKFGTIQDTAILKNFLFDWKKVEEANFVPLLRTWIIYLVKPIILEIGYLAFLFILLGIFISFKERNKLTKALFFLFLTCLFFIVGMNFPFTPVYTFFQNNFSFLKEALRMPFTKFSLVLMLAYAVFFALGNNLLLEKISKRLPKIKSFYVTLWMILLIVFCWPFFKGELISPAIKVKIPEEYFQTFEFFNRQNNLGRIANFPSPVYSGWEYYDWGFQGAGFFWFGQKMSFLNRDFDRWNPANENYYHEISYALYSQSLPLLENILEKYQISWLLLDGNIVSYTSPKSLYFDQLEKLISDSGKVKFSASFGKIKIYRVLLETKPKDFIFLTQDLPKIEPVYKWNNLDQAFVDYGSYTSEVFPSPSTNSFTSEVKRPSIYYPFRSLFTGRKQEELEFKVEENGDSFIFKAKIPKELIGNQLVLPEISEPEVLEIAEDDLTKIKAVNPIVYLDGELLSVNYTSEESLRNTSEVTATGSSEVKLEYINDGNLEVKVPKVQGIFSYDSNKDSDFFNKKSQTCDAVNQGKYSLEQINENGQNFLRFSALNSSSCLDLNLPNLGNRYSYLVTVESRNLKGKSLLFWLENLQSRKADIETYLPKFTSEELWLRKLSLPPSEVFYKSFFIQPPMEKYGLGYSLHFNNISIGNDETINDLVKVTVHPIPYKFLTGIKIINDSNHLPGEVAPQSNAAGTFDVPPAVHLEGESDLQVSHPNESFYKVEISPSFASKLEASEGKPNTYLILSQSYSGDWMAFEKTGRFSFNKLKDHVLVNNWQNGWQLNQSTIYIIFWPQVLEYLGFILLLLAPIIVWKVPLDK